MPSSVVIKVGGIVLTEGYTYDSATGVIHIDGAKITGPVVIIAAEDLPEDYSVTENIKNGVYIGGGTAIKGIEYSASITVSKGYLLPSSITVKVGGVTLVEGIDFTYNSETGELTVFADKVTGNIEIIAVATKIVFTVSGKIDDSVFTGEPAVYGEDYQMTLIPLDGYMLPKSIIVMVDGVIITDGYTYDYFTGVVHINGIKVLGEVQIIAKMVEVPVVPEMPKTGDSAKTDLLFGLIVLSGTTLIVSRQKKRRVNN